jgi:predicted dehydrogenase
MAKTCNWGIIGLGRIARKFADDLRALPHARLHAVASTDLQRAQGFAAEYGVPHAFGTYADIVHCPDLDVVYVATPHVGHWANTLLCLRHGIPVLCEKPFAMDAGQARDMIATARANGVFLMEAMWSRFIPATLQALQWVEAGLIGDLHTIKADLGFAMPFDAQSRVFDKALGGGSLLDLGIYPAYLAQLFWGKPDPRHISAAATFAETEVDDNCLFTLQYPGKGLMSGHSSLRANTSLEAFLYGSEGHIQFHPRWHHSTRLTLVRYEGRQQHSSVLELPYEGWGYGYEAAHVMECLERSASESPLWPLQDSLDLAETLDAIRATIGLDYASSRMEC